MALSCLYPAFIIVDTTTTDAIALPAPCCPPDAHGKHQAEEDLLSGDSSYEAAMRQIQEATAFVHRLAQQLTVSEGDKTFHEHFPAAAAKLQRAGEAAKHAMEEVKAQVPKMTGGRAVSITNMVACLACV